MADFVLQYVTQAEAEKLVHIPTITDAEKLKVRTLDPKSFRTGEFLILEKCVEDAEMHRLLAGSKATKTLMKERGASRKDSMLVVDTKFGILLAMVPVVDGNGRAIPGMFKQLNKSVVAYLYNASAKRIDTARGLDNIEVLADGARRFFFPSAVFVVTEGNRDGSSRANANEVTRLKGSSTAVTTINATISEDMFKKIAHFVTSGHYAAVLGARDSIINNCRAAPDKVPGFFNSEHLPFRGDAKESTVPVSWASADMPRDLEYDELDAACGGDNPLEWLWLDADITNIFVQKTKAVHADRLGEIVTALNGNPEYSNGNSGFPFDDKSVLKIVDTSALVVSSAPAAAPTDMSKKSSSSRSTSNVADRVRDRDDATLSPQPVAAKTPSSPTKAAVPMDADDACISGVPLLKSGALSSAVFSRALGDARTSTHSNMFVVAGKRATKGLASGPLGDFVRRILTEGEAAFTPAMMATLRKTTLAEALFMKCPTDTSTELTRDIATPLGVMFMFAAFEEQLHDQLASEIRKFSAENLNGAKKTIDVHRSDKQALQSKVAALEKTIEENKAAAESKSEKLAAELEISRAEADKWRAEAEALKAQLEAAKPAASTLTAPADDWASA